MGRSSFVGRIFTGALSAIMVIGVVLSQSATVAATNGRAAQKPDVGELSGRG